MKANKNGTFRNDLKAYGLMGAKFYAIVEHTASKFKSKKNTMQNGGLYELKEIGPEFFTNGKYFVEVVTDKGTFVAKHNLGVLLSKQTGTPSGVPLSFHKPWKTQTNGMMR
jgi:hypothetical protein